MNQNEPLLSPDWYRIAHLTPRLRSGVHASKQRIRDEYWYVLADGISGRHFRFNEQAYQLISSFDGQASVDEVWSSLIERQADDAPTQGEVIRIVARAFAANLFVGNLDFDTEVIVAEHHKQTAKRRRAWLNPLAFRIPLWDPDEFLERNLGRVRWLFSGTASLIMSLSIGLGAVLLLLNAGDFADYAARNLASGSMLLTLWLVFPAIKALHELSHAFQVKLNGGEVHELGVTLMFLTPIPYVDASASSAFPRKQDRVSVAGAGIFVEAFIASLAMPLWLLLEPGLLREIVFAAVFSGALSTILINGNPLLRFDGYYVLCDLLETPNLGSRSPRYWQVLLKQKLLGVRHVHFGAMLRGERPWLLLYAPLSWAYRAVLIATVGILLAGWSALLGAAVLALGGWMLFGKPLVQALRWLLVSTEVHGYRVRANMLAVTLTAVMIVTLTVVPVPDRTYATALVWLPDNAVLRAESDGVVDRLIARDGQTVRRGDPVAVLLNDQLATELASIDAQIQAQRVEQARNFGDDAQASLSAGESYHRLLAEQSELQRRVASLVVKAQADGVLAIDPSQISPGQYLTQGSVVAHVLTGGPVRIRALVDNNDIALVRKRPGDIRVSLSAVDEPMAQARLVSATPQASHSLPSPALSIANGGSIAVDASDPDGLTAIEPRFSLDLELVSEDFIPVGSRVMAVFDHGSSTVAGIAGRLLRESFLRHFAT